MAETLLLAALLGFLPFAAGIRIAGHYLPLSVLIGVYFLACFAWLGWLLAMIAWVQAGTPAVLVAVASMGGAVAGIFLGAIGAPVGTPERGNRNPGSQRKDTD